MATQYFYREQARCALKKSRQANGPRVFDLKVWRAWRYWLFTIGALRYAPSYLTPQNEGFPSQPFNKRLSEDELQIRYRLKN